MAVDDAGRGQDCSEERKTDWANVSGEYRRDDENDWREFCRPCHKRFDRKFPRDNIADDRAVAA